MKVQATSAWSQQEIFDYLAEANTPLRISFNGNDGYPVICSLWFVIIDGIIWAASHKSSYVIKKLQLDPKVGFEVATNDYPYHGVRGRANVTLLPDRSANILDKVIGKYLQGTNQQLADWLLSRKDDEYAIRIEPVVASAWDFSGRMEKKS